MLESSGSRIKKRDEEVERLHMIDEGVNDTGSKRGKFLIEKRFKKLLRKGGNHLSYLFSLIILCFNLFSYECWRLKNAIILGATQN